MAKGTSKVRPTKRTITALGRRITKFERLETFKAPEGLQTVELITDEVTANCPVTGQPDYYRVVIVYTPKGLCVESKTVKLYFQQFRNKGLFAEAFADRIAKDFCDALKASVTCTVEQKSRGGVSIHATAGYEPTT